MYVHSLYACMNCPDTCMFVFVVCKQRPVIAHEREIYKVEYNMISYIQTIQYKRSLG